MTIETKFNLGDNVFALVLNKVRAVKILKVNIQYGTEIDCVESDDKKHVSSKTPKQYTSYRVEYEDGGGHQNFVEERLFATKQDLLNSL